MDQKDRMLLEARSVMRYTAGVLEKILDDDADLVLSARVIGDSDGEETSNIMDQQPEDRIAKIRRLTFERVAKLGYEVTPHDVERFFDETQWRSLPALNRRAIWERFLDPRYEYPEMPTNPRSTTNTQRLHEDTRIRVESLLEIICLLENLHRIDPSSDILARVRTQRQRYEGFLRKRETPVETMRREAFAQAEEITGVPAKKLAKCFDRVRWSSIRKERFAELEELVFENVPSAGVWRREPDDPVKWQKWKQESNQAAALNASARAALPSVIKLFENLRAEIGNWHRKQANQAMEKATLERTIERAKARLSAHDQAA